MNGAITQKQYQQLLERQESIEGQLKTLSILVRKQLPEEVREDYKVKLETWHNEAKQVQGRTFTSVKALKQFFKSLA